jgi:hypothetical protein
MTDLDDMVTSAGNGLDDVAWTTMEYQLPNHPVALIEYKFRRDLAGAVDTMTGPIRALVELGRRAEVGVWIVNYWHDDGIDWSFFVRSAIADSKGCHMDEIQYVTWLYSLRGYKMPVAQARHLSERMERERLQRSQRSQTRLPGMP